MKQIIVFGFIAALLIGCGAPVAPAVPTPTIEPTVTPWPTPTESFKSQLTNFLQAGSKINALAEQGVTFSELRQEVATAKSLYDLLVETWPKGLPKDDLTHFETAFDGWNLTTYLWNLKINNNDEPVEPNINRYKALVAFGGDQLVYEVHPKNFIVEKYREKKFVSFDSNIGILLGISSDAFNTGKIGILAKLQ